MGRRLKNVRSEFLMWVASVNLLANVGHKEFSKVLSAIGYPGGSKFMRRKRETFVVTMRCSELWRECGLDFGGRS
jgi:hypothetical protein